jgi:uncharacterized protein YaaN involved in tellurite resistance
VSNHKQGSLAQTIVIPDMPQVETIAAGRQAMMDVISQKQAHTLSAMKNAINSAATMLLKTERSLQLEIRFLNDHAETYASDYGRFFARSVVGRAHLFGCPI